MACILRNRHLCDHWIYLAKSGLPLSTSTVRLYLLVATRFLVPVEEHTGAEKDLTIETSSKAMIQTKR